MRKYEVRFCDCGRVHFLEYQKLESVCDGGKYVLHICNNCGRTSLTWLEDCMDGKAWCSREVKDEALDHSNIGLIIACLGEMIRMETGNEATALTWDGFVDWGSNKPKQMNDEEYDKIRRTVNIQHTINWIRDEEKLDAMSCYYIKNLDWTGTKYKKY